MTSPEPSDSVKLFAIDPGGTTGWALFELLPEPHLLGCGQAEPIVMRRLLGEVIPNVQHVACERYAITLQTIEKSRQYDALELIGVTRYLCEVHGVLLELQTPASAKSVATNDLLKKLGWYQPGKEHATDAIRHGVRWLLQHRILDGGILL